MKKILARGGHVPIPDSIRHDRRYQRVSVRARAPEIVDPMNESILYDSESGGLYSTAEASDYKAKMSLEKARQLISSTARAAKLALAY